MKRHWPLVVILLTFVISSWWAQRGGFLLYGEADLFLIDHNSHERSWLSKVLCPHRHDAEHYMARELAHVVENIDARFIHFCVMRGFPHFLSISNYVLLCGVGVMVWMMAERLRIDRLITSLLLLLFYSCPVIFMSGNYVRSGHALATFLMVALVMTLWHFKTAREGCQILLKKHLRQFVASVFALSLLLVWSDRQGLFAAASIALVLSVSRFVCRSHCVIAIVSAIILHMIHYLFIGPQLIAEFTPFASAIVSSNLMAVAGADRGYGPFAAIAMNIYTNWFGGLYIALSNLRFLFGSIPYTLSAALLVWNTIEFRKGSRWIPASVFLLVAVMNAIMLGAADTLRWPDLIASVYYHMIGTTALWLVAGLAVTQFYDSNKILTRWFLVVLICSNVMSMPGHVNDFKRGHLSGFIAGAPFLREALREVGNKMVGETDEKFDTTKRYDTLESCQFTGWNWIMKNPLEYGGKLSAQEFVESSQYLQFVRSEKRLPFGRGGRNQGQQP